MIAADVMTRNVISVPPDATVADAVEMMLGRGISGLLVVDASGMLAGVVTEGDLLRRDELGTQRRRSCGVHGGCGCSSLRGARPRTSPARTAARSPT